MSIKTMSIFRIVCVPVFGLCLYLDCVYLNIVCMYLEFLDHYYVDCSYLCTAVLIDSVCV